MNWPSATVERRTGRFLPREMAEQDAHELTLAIPEAGEQFALFLGSQEIGRKGRWERFGWLC